MRVRLNDGRTVVILKDEWRFCSKHVALLMQLQIEVPSLMLRAETTYGIARQVLVSDLNLDHEELRFLNPADAA